MSKSKLYEAGRMEGIFFIRAVENGRPATTGKIKSYSSASLSAHLSKAGKARAGRPAAIKASRENGKKGGAPKQPRYTFRRMSRGETLNEWTDLTMRDLKRIVYKLWPSKEWPEDDAEFLEELRSYDQQGLQVEEEGK